MSGKDIMAANFRKPLVAATTKAARKLIFESEDRENKSLTGYHGIRPLAWRDTKHDTDSLDWDSNQDSYSFSDFSELPRGIRGSSGHYVLETEVTESVSLTFTTKRYSRIEVEAADFGQMSCRKSNGSTNISASPISAGEERELSQNLQNLTNVMDVLNIDQDSDSGSDSDSDSSPELSNTSCLQQGGSYFNEDQGPRFAAEIGLKPEKCQIMGSLLNSEQCQTNAFGLNVRQLECTSGMNLEQNQSLSGLKQCQAMGSGLNIEQCQIRALGMKAEQYQTAVCELREDHLQASRLNIGQYKSSASCVQAEIQCQAAVSELRDAHMKTFGFDAAQHQSTASNVNVDHFQAGVAKSENCYSAASGFNVGHSQPLTSGLMVAECQSAASAASVDVCNSMTSGMMFGNECPQFSDLSRSNAPFSSNIGVLQYHSQPSIENAQQFSNLQAQPAISSFDFQKYSDSNSCLQSNVVRCDLDMRQRASASQNHQQDPPAIFMFSGQNTVNVQENKSSSFFVNRSMNSRGQGHNFRNPPPSKSETYYRCQPAKINFRASSSEESCASKASSKVDRAESEVDKQELAAIKYMLRNCELFHPLDMEPKLPGPTPDQSPVRSLMDGGDAIDVRGLGNRLSHMQSEGRMRYALKQYVNTHVPRMQGKMDDVIESTIQQIANVSLGGERSRSPREETLSAITATDEWLKLQGCSDGSDLDRERNVPVVLPLAPLERNVPVVLPLAPLDGEKDGIVELHQDNLEHHQLGNDRPPMNAGWSFSECSTVSSRETSEFTRITNRLVSENGGMHGNQVNGDTRPVISIITSGSERKRKRKIRELVGETNQRGKKRVSFAFAEESCSEFVSCKKAYLD